MNERGVVVLDSILVLAILLIIGLTIIPGVRFLQTEVYYARQLVHASEVAYNGASIVMHEHINRGTQIIESVTYDWQFNGDEICVNFMSIKGEERYCIYKEIE